MIRYSGWARFGLGRSCSSQAYWFGSKKLLSERASGNSLCNDCTSRFLGTHRIGALPFPKPLFCGRLSSNIVSSFSLAPLDLPIRPLIAILLLDYSINFIPYAIDKGINMRSYSFGSRYATWVFDKSVKYFRTKHTDLKTRPST
jgi:hypothetical protein